MPKFFKLSRPELQRLWAEVKDRNNQDNINKLGKKGIFIKITLRKTGFKDKIITALADTGSNWSLISEKEKHFAIDLKPLNNEINLVGATGNSIPGAGIGLFGLRIGDIDLKTDFFVVNADLAWDYPIIGLSLMEKLKTKIDMESKTLTIYAPSGKSEIKYTQFVNKSPSSDHIKLIKEREILNRH